jgi:hypothetical protein
MKKTKIQKLYTIESKLYNRYNNKKYQLTKERILKIQIEIIIAQADELFFNEVEEALKNGWASNEEEKNYWLRLLTKARNGDKNALISLRNEFKYNESFKKETARFKNV